MLTKITFTGADNSVNPEELIEFSQQYPFVEWGILFAGFEMINQPRFPTTQWVNRLTELHTKSDKMSQFCAHLCGTLVKKILLSKQDKKTYDILTNPIFTRVQLNTHGKRHRYNEQMISLLTFSDYFKERNKFLLNIESKSKEKIPQQGTEYIFQHDGENNELLALAKDKKVNVAALFDTSHGAGILPSTWPEALHNIHCGYAGGLSPENILEELPKIEAAAAGRQYWIDMETHVRSNDFTKFDMKKVESVVAQILKAQYIEPKQKSASTSPRA